MPRHAAFIILSVAGLAASVTARYCPPGSEGTAPPAPQAAMGMLAADEPVAPVVQPPRTPQVQIAILLDTSSSMDGLIAQAKSQLWNIVNNLATAKRNGVRPQLNVALYEYGKSSLSPGEGFIRQILPLTTDLDEVSAQLFALTTNGGEEYCAQVIQSATNGLQWSTNTDDLKFILIAGNEPFNQGGVDYKVTVPAALQKGITVNTIHCGDEQGGIGGMWKDGAVLGEGTYSFIDTNAAAVHIDSPFDAEILTLSTEINTTYLAYGAKGDALKERQLAQDSNALAVAPGAAIDRAQTKASGAYSNVNWDLVDGVKDKKVNLAEAKEEDLPEALRTMTPAQREEHVAGLAKKRADIQQRIGELNAKRDQFVTAERAKQAGGQDQTLETAIIKSLKAQAVKKGYEFGSK